jgi:quercetin dioxygenase-like cupin family protein
MTIQTHPREERVLSAPWLLFNIREQLEILKRESEWQANGHNSITLMKTPGLSVVLIALKAGDVMGQHHATGPMAMQVFSGSIRVGFAGDRPAVGAGEFITVNPQIAHEVTALEESAILLFVSQ